jgi:Predicted Zn-dependent protease (DUF2268)
MSRYRFAFLACAVLGGSTLETTRGAVPAAPDVRIEDVARFYAVYDAAHGRPTAEQLQLEYLDKGTEDLRTFLKLRGTTAARIAESITQQPQLYADARRCATVLPRARTRLGSVLRRLRDIYPAARLPPVTVVIGRGRPIGVGSPVTGLQIGLEALCGVTYSDADPEDRFVHIVAHEYVHAQQPRELVDDENPTVLEGSLVEGAAEFVGELISGAVSYAQQAASLRGREAQIDSRFVADLDKRDLSDWLYNGSMEKAGDIGYWVGYRIVKTYYDRAQDKRAAVRDIIEMRDPKAFLANSGWHPAGKSP